jgi:hypothetical protein
MSRIAGALTRLFDLLALEVGPVGVVALVVGADGETIDLCLTDDDDACEERARLLLDVYAGDAYAVVFATVRTGPIVVLAGERARYERLRRHGEHVGLPVLDWFVISDDGERQSLAGANVPPERQ